MQLINSYLDFWRQYVNFTGRTTRSGFWYVVLANNLVVWLSRGLMLFATAQEWFGAATFFLALLVTYSLATIVPMIAIGVRRLRDAGYPASFYFLTFLPVIGGLALLVLWCKPTQAAAQTQAPIANPYYGTAYDEALPAALKNSGNYTGRSTRAEFWWLMLLLVPYYIVAAGFSMAIPGVLPLWLLLPALPVVPLIARRYRDVGMPASLGIIQSLWALCALALLLTMSVHPETSWVLWAPYLLMTVINVFSAVFMLVITVLPSDTIGQDPSDYDAATAGNYSASEIVE